VELTGRAWGASGRLAHTPPVRLERVNRTLSVANLNIVGTDATARQYGLGTFAQRLPALERAVAGFDLVALQEVASRAQAATVARRAGYRFYDAHGELAILSRWPLTTRKHLYGDMPGCVAGINCGGEVHIQAATARVDGEPVRIVNTHLSADYDGPACVLFICHPQHLDRGIYRAAQARQIRDRLVAPFAGHVLVAGDFNGNTDLAAPTGPLTDAYTAPTRVSAPNPATGALTDHCGHRIELILMSAAMTPLHYDGVYGRCPADLALSDHPRTSAVLGF
jgi:endonuclease/exonuclease/phosphatase family metal-dependent hydrolase